MRKESQSNNSLSALAQLNWRRKISVHREPSSVSAFLKDVSSCHCCNVLAPGWLESYRLLRIDQSYSYSSFSYTLLLNFTHRKHKRFSKSTLWDQTVVFGAIERNFYLKLKFELYQLICQGEFCGHFSFVLLERGPTNSEIAFFNLGQQKIHPSIPAYGQTVCLRYQHAIHI